MRKNFDEQLEVLNDCLIEMGKEIEYAITTAVTALESKDAELAKKAIAYDDEIDAKEKEIENLCLKLLLLQQPVASDLRLISAALKMITDMERIGDQSADISEITILLAKQSYIKQLIHIPRMAEATVLMVNKAIEAFVSKDSALAKFVISYDDIVDELFDIVKNDLIELIKKDINNCAQAFDLMMIAKYFERIGDHAVNIAEWVLFSLTGTHDYDSINMETNLSSGDLNAEGIRG